MTHDFDLTLLFISETRFNDENTAIKKRKIAHFATTSFSAAKSISSHKFNVSTFASVETSTSLSTYRFVLSSSCTYKSYKKLYFTIVDLYMRYTSLNRSSFIITRIIIILFIIFI